MLCAGWQQSTPIFRRSHSNQKTTEKRKRRRNQNVTNLDVQFKSLHIVAIGSSVCRHFDSTRRVSVGHLRIHTEMTHRPRPKLAPYCACVRERAITWFMVVAIVCETVTQRGKIIDKSTFEN